MVKCTTRLRGTTRTSSSLFQSIYNFHLPAPPPPPHELGESQPEERERGHRTTVHITSPALRWSPLEDALTDINGWLGIEFIQSENARPRRRRPRTACVPANRHRPTGQEIPFLRDIPRDPRAQPANILPNHDPSLPSNSGRHPAKP